MPTRWLGAWSNGANGSEWSWSIRLHGGGKTSVSSLGVWDKRNLPYDALQRGVLSPLSKTYPRKGVWSPAGALHRHLPGNGEHSHVQGHHQDGGAGGQYRPPARVPGHGLPQGAYRATWAGLSRSAIGRAPERGRGRTRALARELLYPGAASG